MLYIDCSLNARLKSQEGNWDRRAKPESKDLSKHDNKDNTECE